MIESDPRYRRHFSHLEADCERLLEQWAANGAPIARLLRPGLSGHAIDALAAEHGLTLPPELRFWWSWHDGVDTDLPRERDIGPGGFELLSLEQALAQYELNRQTHREDPDLGDIYWRSSWLPFMTQGPQRVYVDCDRIDEMGQSPIRIVTWEWDGYDIDSAKSLSHALSIWTWLLSEGIYRWNGEACDCDFARIPRPILTTSLA